MPVSNRPPSGSVTIPTTWLLAMLGMGGLGVGGSSLFHQGPDINKVRAIAEQEAAECEKKIERHEREGAAWRDRQERRVQHLERELIELRAKYEHQ